jgi:hypothetical protein
MRFQEINDRLSDSHTKKLENNIQYGDGGETCWRDAEGEKRLWQHLSDQSASSRTKDFSAFIFRQKHLGTLKNDIYLTTTKFRIWHGFACLVRETEIQTVTLMQDVYDGFSNEQTDSYFSSINGLMSKLASLVVSDKVNVASQWIADIRRDIFVSTHAHNNENKQSCQSTVQERVQAVNASEANSEAKFFASARKSLATHRYSKSSCQLNGNRGL